MILIVKFYWRYTNFFKFFLLVYMQAIDRYTVYQCTMVSLYSVVHVVSVYSTCIRLYSFFFVIFFQLSTPLVFAHLKIIFCILQAHTFRSSCTCSVDLQNRSVVVLQYTMYYTVITYESQSYYCVHSPVCMPRNLCVCVCISKQ